MTRSKAVGDPSLLLISFRVGQQKKQKKNIVSKQKRKHEGGNPLAIMRGHSTRLFSRAATLAAAVQKPRNKMQLIPRTELLKPWNPENPHPVPLTVQLAVSNFV